MFSCDTPLLTESSERLYEAFSRAVAPGRCLQTLHLLRQLLVGAQEGHLCIPCPEFPIGTTQEVVHEAGWLYLRRLWNLEEQVVAAVRRLLETPPDFSYDMQRLTTSVLEPAQLRAVHLAAKGGVVCISGGPGTGKSFTIKELVRLFCEQHPELKVIIGAPTGKAASNLRGSLDESISPSTLHQLLKVVPGNFPRPPIPLNADLVIIDEASMIDAPLMARLLNSIRPGATLILVGDPDQLPPVEVGGLFTDLCRALPNRIVRLDRSLRVQCNRLVSLAQEIQEGKCSIHPEPLDRMKIEELYPEYRILTSLRQGLFGVDSLNACLSAHIWKRPPPWEFPILITRNSRRWGLSNGETGLLVRHTRGSVTQEDYAQFGAKQIPLLLLPSYQFGFVLSVHKSQGSEYDKVAIILPPGSERFSRQLLYTAVTRARKEVRLYSHPATLQAVLASSTPRFSRIEEKLTLSLK